MRVSMPLRVILSLVVVWTAEQAVAWACTCGSPDRDLYNQVFVGQALGTTGGGCGRDAATHFQVVEAIEGVEVGQTVRISHRQGSAMCGVSFSTGSLYLVYAIDGTTGLCDPGGPVEDAAARTLEAYTDTGL